MSVQFARSLAGHDRTHVYCVVGEEGDKLLLVNGWTKKLASPKRKSKRHIQIIKKLPIDIAQMCLNDRQEFVDEGISKAIDCYQEIVDNKLDLLM